MQVAWIGSFPKSGSTWLRYIVNHILFGEGGKLKPPAVRDSVPDIHDYCEPMRYTWQGLYVLKTHLSFNDLPSRMQTRSFIYVIRHPLDVVDSALAYLAPSPGDRHLIIDSFCKYGSVDPWLSYLKYGSLEENIKSWCGSVGNHHNRLIFRYEDMLADPHKHVKLLGHHFDVKLSENHISNIVEQTSFKSLKKIENDEIKSGLVGFFTDEQSKGGKTTEFRFMRSGRHGSYCENLSEDEIEKLAKRFKPLMDQFNYKLE